MCALVTGVQTCALPIFRDRGRWSTKAPASPPASPAVSNAAPPATVSRKYRTRWGRPARGEGLSRTGLRSPVPRANVARMIKRLFAVFSLLVIALPSLAAAQGVTSSADPRATEAGREILMKGGSAADAEMAMMLVLTLVEQIGRAHV